MSDTTHYGSTTTGEDYEIPISRGVTLTCYDLPVSVKTPRVVVEDGAVCIDFPDEIKSPREARAWAAVLMEAADELERAA